MPCFLSPLRTLLINLLDDIPDTWPILVLSTWEDKPDDASSGGGGGGALGDGDGHGMGFGNGGLHGTVMSVLVRSHSYVSLYLGAFLVFPALSGRP